MMTTDPFYVGMVTFVGLWIAIYLLIVWTAVRKYRQRTIPLWLMLLTIFLLPFYLLLWPLIFEIERRQLRKLQPTLPAPILRLKRLIGWSVYGFVLVCVSGMHSLYRWTINEASEDILADCCALFATLLLLVILSLIDCQLNKQSQTTTKNNC